MVVLVFTAALAGCASSGSTAQPPAGGAFGGDALGIFGIVIDEELMPVVDAKVSNDRDERAVYTDTRGQFSLTPVEEGDYVLTIERQGYATTTKAVSVYGESLRGVTVNLRAIASNVPYHQTFTRATYIICWSQNIVGGVPCTKLVDYVAGTNISNTERFAFTFTIPNEGLADMLVEIIWRKQSLGSDMGFYIQTPPNQPLTGLVTKYFSRSGGPPIQGWLTAGIKNRCGGGECAGVFDATPNKVVYEGVTIGSQGNATIPMTAVYLDHRTDAWFTMFYNRPGPRDFSALPDT